MSIRCDSVVAFCWLSSVLRFCSGGCWGSLRVACGVAVCLQCLPPVCSAGTSARGLPALSALVLLLSYVLLNAPVPDTTVHCSYSCLNI